MNLNVEVLNPLVALIAVAVSVFSLTRSGTIVR